MLAKFVPFILVALVAATPAFAGSQSEGMRQVNVSSDSAPGWTPTAEQEAQAVAAANVYFAAIDGGKYAEAYAMNSDLMKRQVPEEVFTELKRSFHDAAGSLKKRDFLKITWTKDSARAPEPGVYAAIDFAGQFDKVDRSCGYVVMYQKPDGGSFTVMADQNNFITNADAEKLSAGKSPADLDKIWAVMSSNCPNYPAAK
ncbi:MAG: DUF4019 domain-containing protein [Alphaproteobacteria bacterium]